MGLFGTLVMVLALLLTVFLMGGAVFRAAYLRRKRNAIEPYGRLVEVDDGKMHVVSMGSGGKKIVLLPGMGIPLPAADFAPLMRRLAQNHTVICVEYFGVGVSSVTAKPRTCDNYVGEVRTALQQAGFSAPYVLMGHSVSSVYSESYASTYPEEVEALISLDGTSSAYYAEVPRIVRRLLPLVTYMQVLGIMPVVALLTTDRKKLGSYGYTRKEIADSIVFSGFSMNRNLLEQMIGSSEHVKEVINLPFPQTIPYLKIISKTTYETSDKQLGMTPQEYQRQHLERIGPHAKYEVLEGSHFIHVGNTKIIADMTDRFLSH